MEEIAARLFPFLDKKMQLKLLHECCELENVYRAENGGTLYPQLQDTITNSAIDANIPFVFARYGFGDVKKMIS